MNEYAVCKSYPISKNRTNDKYFYIVSSKKQADFIANKLYKKTIFLTDRLTAQYANYIHKHPSCKIRKYIYGLYKLNFYVKPIPKHSHKFLRDNWWTTDYPHSYNLKHDEERLGGK